MGPGDDILMLASNSIINNVCNWLDNRLQYEWRKLTSWQRPDPKLGDSSIVGSCDLNMLIWTSMGMTGPAAISIAFRQSRSLDGRMAGVVVAEGEREEVSDERRRKTALQKHTGHPSLNNFRELNFMQQQSLYLSSLTFLSSQLSWHLNRHEDLSTLGSQLSQPPILNNNMNYIKISLFKSGY